MRPLDLTDPDPLPGHKPERVKLLCEFVNNDPRDPRGEGILPPVQDFLWGALESLRGTSWEAGVRVVPAAVLDHALHGRLTPLLRELGRDPKASARRVALEEGECALKGGCLGWTPSLCRPGGAEGKGRRRKEGPPDCYAPPLSDGTPVEVLEVFQRVAFAWREGRHVVVVYGTGFNFA